MVFSFVLSYRDQYSDLKWFSKNGLFSKIQQLDALLSVIAERVWEYVFELLNYLRCAHSWYTHGSWVLALLKILDPSNY
jgi:hypothetical protein